MGTARTTHRVVGIGLLLGLLAAAPAWAQGVDIQAKPSAPGEPRFEVRPPALHDQVTRPGDADFYPDGPRVQHEPAFIEPFTAETETGRVGLSGWTAPQTPVGPAVGGRREVTGWFAMGLTVTWGGQAPVTRRPAAAR